MSVTKFNAMVSGLFQLDMLGKLKEQEKETPIVVEKKKNQLRGGYRGRGKAGEIFRDLCKFSFKIERLKD
ncbi:hypothetical protein LXL04_006400 [Taraxacum kok-saghyz]